MTTIYSKNMLNIIVKLDNGQDIKGKANVISDYFTLDIEENYDGDYVGVEYADVTGIDEDSFEPENDECYNGKIIDYKILDNESTIEWTVDDFAYADYCNELRDSYCED